tara:strand:+ start:107 stop:490 length:384 start_codon:yes stop_codon:yes gene_type:complete
MAQHKTKLNYLGELLLSKKTIRPIVISKTQFKKITPTTKTTTIGNFIISNEIISKFEMEAKIILEMREQRKLQFKQYSIAQNMISKSGYTPNEQVGYGTTSIAVQNRRTGNMEISEIGSLTKKGDRK